MNILNNPKFVGLVLTYAISMTEEIKNLVYNSTNVMGRMSSIERIKQYCLNNEKEEKMFRRELDNNLGNWPENGEVIFKNFSVRYRRETPLVLENLNIKIKGGEKVAIIGRTGSGKSSIFLSLMRILEKNDDKNTTKESFIQIDGIKIHEVGLETLRKSISIISQFPFLFKGTIKDNLDPSNTFKDEDLIEILGKVKFKNTLNDEIREKINFNILYFKVEKGGNNLSLGQKQLLTIARSLLKKNKILLLDEATSSIDHKTDEIIQEVIRELKGVTVITIAHRINTIVDYDRILVLESGKVIQDGNYEEIKEKNILF